MENPNTSTQHQADPQKNSKTIISLVFVAGLPGIGKSTLFKNVIRRWITEHNFQVVKVESDTIRQKAIKLEKMKPESKSLTALELEIKSKPVYTQMMHDEIRDEIKRLSLDEERNSIFILDKNYVPEKLRQVIFGAAEEFFENIRSFLILPEQVCGEEFAIDVDEKQNPFFYGTLCASLIRSFSRKGHLSLCHGYTHSLKCIVGTLRSYAGQSFEQIADQYKMHILHFDYFNAKELSTDSLRDMVKEKMEIVHQMIKDQDYDGDACKDLLFKDKELVDCICTYGEHDKEYERIARQVVERIE